MTMDARISCAAGALLDTWSKHAWSDGIQLENVRDMKMLSIRTENSIYEVNTISSGDGEILIRGGRFFPVFTPARLIGSSLGGCFLKLRGIYVGFNMEIHCDCRSIITSRVRSISVAV